MISKLLLVECVGGIFEIFTFTGCVRGFCGITSYVDPVNKGELVFSTSVADIHTINSKVENLSVLFLKEFYQKVK